MSIAPLPFDLERDLKAAPQLDGEYLMDIAKHAAATVLRRRFSVEDYEDAVQCAALEVWKSYQRHGNPDRGYLFGAGRYALYNWLAARRQRVPETALDTLEWRLTSEADDQPSPWLTPERLASLGLDEREVSYVLCRADGFNLTACALELGISEDKLYRLRTRLLPKLYAMAGETPDRPQPQYEQIGPTIHRWRAIDLPWSIIVERLQITEKAATAAYGRWCKRQLAKEAQPV